MSKTSKSLDAARSRFCPSSYPVSRIGASPLTVPFRADHQAQVHVDVGADRYAAANRRLNPQLAGDAVFPG